MLHDLNSAYAWLPNLILVDPDAKEFAFAFDCKY